MASGDCDCCQRHGVLIHRTPDRRKLWLCGDCDWELTNRERAWTQARAAAERREQGSLTPA